MTATPAWPPRSAPRLFVESTLSSGLVLTIEGTQAHYLSRVMRVKQGEIIVLCDDQTGEWTAKVRSAGKRDVTLEITEKLRGKDPVPDFWLCPALLKKDRFDLVLEKACELGVAQIMPVLTHRCVADKLNPVRARSILTEAAEQCARTALPQMTEVQKLDALLANWPQDRALFFADEQGGKKAVIAFADHKGPSALLVGPEGGFDDGERAAIRALPQSVPITLGPRILRGETAAIAATALWMGQSGDW